jgi:hypothetical protein
MWKAMAKVYSRQSSEASGENLNDLNDVVFLFDMVGRSMIIL